MLEKLADITTEPIFGGFADPGRLGVVNGLGSQAFKNSRVEFLLIAEVVIHRRNVGLRFCTNLPNCGIGETFERKDFASSVQ